MKKRVHVHILSPDGETKFWIEPVVALADYTGFSDKQIRELSKIVEKNVKEIEKAWKSISNAEIQNISNKGIWLLVNGQEFFMPFTEFPWFAKATVEQIYNLELFRDKYLHWPSLDIDIDIDSIKYPEAYPLKYS